jgi:hypothetical protein
MKSVKSVRARGYTEGVARNREVSAAIDFPSSGTKTPLPLGTKYFEIVKVPAAPHGTLLIFLTDVL